MTKFESNALDAIRALKGIYFATDDKGKPAWVHHDGKTRIEVMNADGRTRGIIGNPTMTALINAGRVKLEDGSKYIATN